MNPPRSNTQKRRFWGKMIWISGIFLILSVCTGIALCLISILRTSDKLKVAGAADSTQLAGDISNAISSALIGPLLASPFAIISLILFITAILRHRKFSNPAQAD